MRVLADYETLAASGGYGGGMGDIPNGSDWRHMAPYVQHILVNPDSYSAKFFADPLAGGTPPFGSIGDLAKAIWNLPNTMLGLIAGLAGHAYDNVFGDRDSTITLSNGTIQFQNNPFVVDGSALTLGAVSIFSGTPSTIIPPGGWQQGQHTVATHEAAHTQQGNMTGPFYLPLYAIGGIWALFQGGSPIGPLNFMESGPYSDPPVAFN
jgi:hypothetical protein